jgi:hypothetical protein
MVLEPVSYGCQDTTGFRLRFRVKGLGLTWLKDRFEVGVRVSVKGLVLWLELGLGA